MPAAEYEAYTSQYLKPWDKMFIERCIEENPCKNNSGKLLDVGTGTAVLLEELIKTKGFENYHLVGIDYFQDNVEEANLKILDKGLENRIEVQVGDAHYLDFQEKEFDMVVSRATVHHLIDPVTALREKYRVLKTGGVCLIHDMRRDVKPEVLLAFNDLRAKANYPPTVVREKYTVSEMKDFLEQAGLKNCSYVYSSSTGLESLGFEVKIWKE